MDVVENNAALLLHEDDNVLAIPGDGFRARFETNVIGAIAEPGISLPRRLPHALT